jgi:hypothetical protein
MATSAAPNLTPAQHALLNVWQKHVLAEFVTKNVQDALDTMTEDAYVNNVPLLLGGLGKEGVRDFYSTYFVAQMPPIWSPTSFHAPSVRIGSWKRRSFGSSVAWSWTGCCRGCRPLAREVV